MPLTVLVLFFRNFFWITTSITLFECYLLALSGDAQVVMVLLWTKIAADVVLGILFLLLRGDKLYFYHNLGYSRTFLLGGALAVDLLVWTILITITAAVS